MNGVPASRTSKIWEMPWRAEWAGWLRIVTSRFGGGFCDRGAEFPFWPLMVVVAGFCWGEEAAILLDASWWGHSLSFSRTIWKNWPKLSWVYSKWSLQTSNIQCICWKAGRLRPIPRCTLTQPKSSLFKNKMGQNWDSQGLGPKGPLSATSESQRSTVWVLHPLPFKNPDYRCGLIHGWVSPWAQPSCIVCYVGVGTLVKGTGTKLPGLWTEQEGWSVSYDRV